MPNSLRGSQLACLVIAVCLAGSSVHVQAQRRTLFSFDAPTGAVPRSIARARDGTLYSATLDGGRFGKGAVVAVARGTAKVLYSFRGQTDGAAPSSIVLGGDGALYGLSSLPAMSDAPAQSALFRVTKAGAFSVLSQLSGASNMLVLVLGQDGVVYVSSADRAAVLALDEYEGGLRPAFSFDAGTWVNTLVITRRGELFGTTQVESGASQIVKAAQGGAVSVLASLPIAEDGSNRELATALARTKDGSLYVATQGGASAALYSFKSPGTLQTVGVLDAPARTLVAAASGNSVIGVTSYGGSTKQGSLFQVAGGQLSTLASFSGGPEGASPNSLIVGSNAVYGSASDGGGAGFGTLFRYRTGEALSAAYSFTYPNGMGPSSLLLGSDGAMYGVTLDGGPGGAGTVFKTDKSGTLEILHAFAPSEGASPQNLIEGQDGALYGRTVSGGSAGYGGLFKLTKAGELTVLAQFTEDGQGRGPKLVQLPDGTLYGGDEAGSGHIFRFTPSTPQGQIEQVHAFTGLMTREGAEPSGLVAGPNGVLYGVTRGAYGPMIPPPFSSGTVFRLNTDGTLDTLYAFGDDKNALGALPQGLLLGQDGLLYGSSSNLSFLCNVTGSLWKMAPEGGGKPSKTYAFTGHEDGTGPTSLLQTQSGRFFGLTLGGRGYWGEGEAANSCVVRNSTLFEHSELAGFRTLAQLDFMIGASSNSVSTAQASSLIEGDDARLYGTFASGGSAGAGELFVFDLQPPPSATTP